MEASSSDIRWSACYFLQHFTFGIKRRDVAVKEFRVLKHAAHVRQTSCLPLREPGPNLLEIMREMVEKRNRVSERVLAHMRRMARL